jgi:hypothetical protein
MTGPEQSTDTLPPALLSPQQVKFFETFGFVRLPGLFRDDLEEISDAFESVFATATPIEMRETVHFDQRRQAIPLFLDYHPRLKQLETDPRVLGVVRSLLGDEFEYRQADGNLLWCDTSWHCDIYGAPLKEYNIKLFFYLDQLDGSSGALRVIPGTNLHDSRFAVGLRNELQPWDDIEARFGVSPEEIPGYAIPNEPGDVIVGSFRTMHATFGGPPRRRLFTINYRQGRPEPTE